MNNIENRQLMQINWLTKISLFASGSTLICCALPAALVAVGAGAALSSFITVFPQLVWFSEYKAAVFLMAAIMLLIAGVMQFFARGLPCPVDPVLAWQCLKTRRMSLFIYFVSIGVFILGAVFAFLLPLLTE